MEIEYKRDLNSNYMILKCSEVLDMESFQVRMLQANHIPGLLKLSIREMDNRSLLYYDITSRQSLHAILEHHKVSGKMLRDLFRAFFGILDQLQEYLLPPDGLMLQPELIYAEGDWEKYAFVFLPGRGSTEPDLQKKLIELMEILLPKLDHSNQQGVVLGYSLYREVTSDQFSLVALKTLIFNEQISDAEQLFGESIPGQRNPVPDQDAYRSDEAWNLDERKLAEELVGELTKSDSVAEGTHAKAVLLFPGFLLLGGGIIVWIQYATLLYSLIMAAAGSIALILAVIILLRQGNKRKDVVQVSCKHESEQDELWDEMEVYLPKNTQEDPAERAESTGRNLESEKLDRESAKLKIPQKMLYEVTEVLYLSEKEEQQYRLFPENQDMPVLEFGDKAVILVGKLASAVDFVLPVGTVSRMHAKLERKEEGIFLSDLNSRNGTFVNGELLQNGQVMVLSPGDEILFADQKYTVQSNEN